MPRLIALLACLLCCTACQERTATSAEEQHLLERLTRDPNVRVTAIDRNDDRHLVVTTRQGDVISTYIFKPDVPGEKRLNIHRLSGSSRLDIATGAPPAPWRTR
jgi:hypothetical protein